MKIALTGGIACGKSLVAKFLNEFGVETIDADDIVHELIPDPAERKRLAAEVFADSVKRRALEERIHPAVRRRLDEFLAKDDGRLRLVIVPLLFETGWDKSYDIVCCVASDRETQIARMLAMRGYTRAEAEARLAAQWPVAEKVARARFVITNNGTPEDLRREVVRLVAALS